MKPMMIVPPGVIDDQGLAALKENGVCIVVASDPSAVRFMDPIPSATNRDQIETAAINLSRKLLAGELVGSEYRKNVAALYVDLLVQGTALDKNPTQEEREKTYFNTEKLRELSRLAKEEAAAERAAQKAAQAKAKSK